MMSRGVAYQRKHYHYNTHDLDRPNFIFSSDIPDKVDQLSHEYLSIRDKQQHVKDHNNDDEEEEHVISLTTENIEFNINIELNTLLLYNPSFKPSDLIHENHICLAKPEHIDFEIMKSDQLIFKNGNTENYKGIQPYVLKSKEIFIINITLKLLTFNVFNHDSPIIIDFVKDENYTILLLCKSILLCQIEKYITLKFIKEVNKNLVTPLPFPETSIVEDEDGYPTPQEISKYTTDTLFNDSTLEGSENESVVGGKTFLYDDDEEEDDEVDRKQVEDDFQDLLLLNSNDTIRYISHDEDYDDIGFSVKTASKLLPKTILSTIKEEKKSDSFIENLNNLRHNDLNDDIDFVDIDDDEHDSEHDDINRYILDDLQHLQPPIQLRLNINQNENTNINGNGNSTEIISPPMTPAKTLTRQSSYLSYLSPTKATTNNKTVSRMTSTASLSFINSDDTTGLEYAYRDRSPTVPSFIKEDKKFRFIKVGKVQKFVDLFEEKKKTDITPILPPPPPIFRSNSKQVSPGLE
ncbi:hypothetical protein DFJ63DRAFT_24724 [Scheffersomyces coipomensis]|uniref:uncharacterized protein n=1 Tax=Scheffersomyces coipomensis TaxID=1788519 RepID=UPI00315C7462